MSTAVLLTENHDLKSSHTHKLRGQRTFFEIEMYDR